MISLDFVIVYYLESGSRHKDTQVPQQKTPPKPPPIAETVEKKIEEEKEDKTEDKEDFLMQLWSTLKKLTVQVTWQFRFPTLPFQKYWKTFTCLCMVLLFQTYF